MNVAVPPDPPAADGVGRSATAPGWYRDPWGVSDTRWWDGRQWSGATSEVGPDGEMQPVEARPSLPVTGSGASDRPTLWYLGATVLLDLTLLLVLVGSTGTECSDPNLGQPNAVTGVAAATWLAVVSAASAVAIGLARARSIGRPCATTSRVRTARVCAAISFAVLPLAAVLWIATGTNCGL